MHAKATSCSNSKLLWNGNTTVLENLMIEKKRRFKCVVKTLISVIDFFLSCGSREDNERLTRRNFLRLIWFLSVSTFASVSLSLVRTFSLSLCLSVLCLSLSLSLLRTFTQPHRWFPVCFALLRITSDSLDGLYSLTPCSTYREEPNPAPPQKLQFKGGFGLVHTGCVVRFIPAQHRANA